MSVSYSARALIGCCLNHAQLFKKRTVKVGKHSHPTTWKVDPVTSAPLWKEEEFCVLEGFDADEDTSCVEPHRCLDGLYLFDDAGHDDRARYLIGALADVDESEPYRERKNFALIDGAAIETTRGLLKKLLTPHGLWSEARFGLWVVQYVSF